jgi:ribonucleoside-triphosphate reductase
MKVTKRNGEPAEFNRSKIVNAVSAAFKECGYESIPKTIEEIVDEVQIWDNISIEDIQDQVEELLMDYGYSDVAKAYILYREERKMIRAEKDKLIKGIKSKLEASNVKNQNANIDEHSFGGRIGEAGRVVTKDYALNYCMSEMAKHNHENNEIYIHDLDSYAVGMHNCLSIPVDDLLANGFKLKQTDVRPAKSINTAFQLLAVIFQVQSLQQFGGVSATHLDWTMVPYVRLSFNKHYRTGLKYIDHIRNEKYDQTDLSIEDSLYKEHPNSYEYALDMTKREIHQAVEGMYHNLNTLQSRSGNQLPFTSINYGTCTQPEGRLISLALLEVSKNGIGSHHSTPIFPCCIVQLMKGVNRKPGDPNYDIFQEATKVTSLRLYPNYANVDWSGNEGYDINDPRTYFSTMGK